MCSLIINAFVTSDACPPIVHAYIATSKLVVHACMSISLSNVYVLNALLMFMNLHFNMHAYVASMRALLSCISELLQPLSSCTLAGVYRLAICMLPALS
jgi:hypothetical protein